MTHTLSSLFASALVCLALAVPAFAQAPPPYTEADGVAPLYGQKVIVLVPNASSARPYRPDVQTPLIIYCHGAGESEHALLDDGLKASCVTALLNRGFLLAGTNAHGPQNWGNQASVDDYADLYNYVNTHYNIGRVLLWSQSMGGLDGLLVLSQNKVPNVAGWLGTYPVCGLGDGYRSGIFTAGINEAYGITDIGPATFANMTFGNDPTLKWGNAFRNVPMRFYASYGDTVVPRAHNTDVVAALVAHSAREATVVTCTGNHGDPSHFQPSDYIAFFDRCLADPPPTSGGSVLRKTRAR